MSWLSKRIRSALGIERVKDAYLPKTWEERAAIALASPDNAHIPRVPDAGLQQGGWLTMHNGLVVSVDSYYDPSAMELMRQNRGVHEPQEERAFQEVLPRLRPDAVMVELGAYWCFYSMWFARQVGPCARCICVEALPENLEAGRHNVAHNGIISRFDFVHAYADRTDSTGADGVARISIPGLMRSYSVDRIDLLHADVQGAERTVLEGAHAELAAGAIDHIFISTHSANLHNECVRLLRFHHYIIDADIPPKDSYSYDGLIVATSPKAPPLALPELSRRRWKRGR